MISRVVKILKFTKGNQSGLTRGEWMGGFWDLGGTWEGPGGEFGSERLVDLVNTVNTRCYPMFLSNTSPCTDLTPVWVFCFGDSEGHEGWTFSRRTARDLMT